VIQLFDSIKQMVVHSVVLGINNSIEIRKVAVKVDVVGIGSTGQEVFSTLMVKNIVFAGLITTI
jgi:hypothetical protein